MLDPKKEKVFSNEERLTFLQVDEFSAEKLLSWQCSTERNYAVWIHKCDLTALTADVNCVGFWVCHCPSVRLNAQSQLQERKMRETWGKFRFMFVTLFSHLEGCFFTGIMKWHRLQRNLLSPLSTLWSVGYIIISVSLYPFEWWDWIYEMLRYLSLFFAENREEDSVLWQVSNTWLGIVCSTCHPRRRNGTNSLLNCPH
jgi:hypothetical protein